jgi:hypothetical protein
MNPDRLESGVSEDRAHSFEAAARGIGENDSIGTTTVVVVGDLSIKRLRYPERRSH